MPTPTLITLYPHLPRHTVSPYIYGQFAEHIGGCVYDGIWVGENSPIPNEGGIRLDTIEALRRLHLPIVRWPGGLFADNYHWRDGIGPRAGRPRRYNLGWGTIETNEFGTEEFMRFCRLIGTEAYLCCNIGSGTVEEARSWVEYCNCDKDTELTRLRAANGSPASHNVRVWGMGNEPWYPLDGMMSAEYYTNQFRAYAGYIKRFASQSIYEYDDAFNAIKLIACLYTPEWNDTFFRMMSQSPDTMRYVDLISPHIYCGGSAPKDAAPDVAYYCLMSELARFEQVVDQSALLAKRYGTPEHQIQVAVDEWGTWHPQANPYNGCRQDNTMKDALFAAVCFHIFHDHGDTVYMANSAQLANVLQGIIFTDGEKFCTTPTYHVFDMFQAHKSGTVIQAEIEGNPTLDLPNGAKRDQLSVSATMSGNGEEIFVSVVNLSLEKDVAAKIDFTGSDGSTSADGRGFSIQEIRQLSGQSITSQNTYDAPESIEPVSLEPTDIATGQEGCYKFKAQSITTMRMRS